jgi:transposase
MDLTDDQWSMLKPHIPEPEILRTSEKGGRPWRDPRDVLNGILWILRTGAQWSEMPRKYPPYSTCHRRFTKWTREGVLDKILRALAEHLRDIGKVDLTEAFIDGSHAGAKRGVLMLAELDAARRPRSWQWSTAMVFLSPSGLRVVSVMKQSSSCARLSRDSSRRCPNA